MNKTIRNGLFGIAAAAYLACGTPAYSLDGKLKTVVKSEEQKIKEYEDKISNVVNRAKRDGYVSTSDIPSMDGLSHLRVEKKMASDYFMFEEMKSDKYVIQVAYVQSSEKNPNKKNAGKMFRVCIDDAVTKKEIVDLINMENKESLKNITDPNTPLPQWYRD